MYNDIKDTSLEDNDNLNLYLLRISAKRGIFALLLAVAIFFMFFAYYVYLYNKSDDINHSYAALINLVVIILSITFIFVLKYISKNKRKYTSKTYFILICVINISLLICGTLTSVVLDNPVILYIYIIIVSIVPIVPIPITIFQFSFISVFYLVANYCYNNYFYNLLPTLIIVGLCTNIISITFYKNMKNIFFLNQEFEIQKSLLQDTNNKLLQDSYSDSLTGVNNRRRIDDLLKSYWKLCKANEQFLSIIFIDFDNFKKYNDYYGHLEGDKCLKIVSNTINKLCSSLMNKYNCSLGRYGGEEFIIILPNINKDDAITFGIEICKNVENLKIPHETTESGSKYVTVSCGITTMVPNNSNRLLYMLDTADIALYYVKENGKNNVKHYEDLPLDYFRIKY